MCFLPIARLMYGSARIANCLTLGLFLAVSHLAAESNAQLSNPGFGATARETDEVRRNRLVDEVLVPAGISNPRVIDAMRKTERHEFVAREYNDRAYLDMALPIGDSQTISSPWIVATMTQALDPQPTDKVLEIGTGSGYQAAVLSPLVDHVYSIEIVETLGRRARVVLDKLKYTNVTTKIGDGFKGWEEYQPFDKIIVTCSPEDVPQPLIDQLREGGLMVIPVGERYQQTLYLMRKKGDALEREALLPTLFVPMTGKAEDERDIKADPNHPKILNGDFEEPLPANGYVEGWYYQRGLTLVKDETAPSGKQFVRFDNDVFGRPTSLLQGFALDGRVIPRIKISANVKTSDVKQGVDKDELPTITLQFFDAERRRLSMQWIGPFRGTSKWRKESKTFRVPPETREVIVSIGLFGATGSASYDNIQLEPLKK